ncbi:hypothetical protein [Loktanella sp. S4079]|uniref:hypothetical protein n=1 Tax=Loktanella sp. S4079 TaxID=579483 RepID=UPI0005F9D2ED|nr:hypothetical protein [Loktanella sp. S4079]KJZ20064.1 hypothetical protein TW80_04260 [Loktanella sp. S4079]
MSSLKWLALGGVCAAVCALFATTANANGNDQISLGHIEADGFSGGYLFGDFTLGLEQNNWGAELGMFGVVGRLHETYAAVTWSHAEQKVELGFPRPTYDQFAKSALTALMPRYALWQVDRTMSRATAGVFYESNFLPYGGAYRIGQSGLSLHGVPDTDIAILGAGTEATYGPWRLAIATEAVTELDVWRWNTKAQAAYDFGTLQLQGSVFVGRANGAADMAELSVQIAPIPEVELAAVVQHTKGSHLAVGAGAQYEIWPGIAADLAALRDGQDQFNISAALTHDF